MEAYRYCSTFSQESKPTQTGEHRVSLTVLPPPPLELKAVDSGKAEEHAGPGEAGNTLKNDDPLAECYAQARADREAQVSRTIGDPSGFPHIFI